MHSFVTKNEHMYAGLICDNSIFSVLFRVQSIDCFQVFQSNEKISSLSKKFRRSPQSTQGYAFYSIKVVFVSLSVLSISNEKLKCVGKVLQDQAVNHRISIRTVATRGDPILLARCFFPGIYLNLFTMYHTLSHSALQY